MLQYDSIWFNMIQYDSITIKLQLHYSSSHFDPQPHPSQMPSPPNAGQRWVQHESKTYHHQALEASRTLWTLGGLMKASETHWNSMNSPFWLSFEPADLLSFQMSKSSFPSLLHCNQCSKIHTSYFFRWRLLTLLGAFFPPQTSRLILNSQGVEHCS